MPPPLPNQQGSRAGLITALVIFIIGFIVAAIFAFYNYSGWQKAIDAKVATEQRVKDVATNDEIENGADFKTAVGQKDAYHLPSALAVLAEQRRELAKTVTGQATPSPEAKKMGEAALTAANETIAKAGLKPGTDGPQLSTSDSLIGALSQYEAALVRAVKAERDAKAATEAVQKERDALAQKAKDDLAAKDKEIAAREQKTTEVSAQFDQYKAQKDQQIDQLTTQTSAQIKALSDAVAALQTQGTDKDAQIRKLQNQSIVYLNSLKRFRLDPKENLIRSPDGVVTRVTGDGFCYINRGMGDHINVGLTFEVYDRVKGIPPLADGMASDETVTKTTRIIPGAGGGATAVPGALSGRGGSLLSGLETEMPKGKGSIEVVSVGPGNTSQCRITHVEPGLTIDEGDVIGNLVYDPRVKLTFAVYGDFDLDGNGVPSAQDTNVIKRLIEQWGGKVIVVTKPEDISVSVDFLVMGLEPRIPNLPDAPTPQDQDNQQKAIAAKKAYDDIRGRGSELGIPILNQNRFLYYVGYYNIRTR